MMFELPFQTISQPSFILLLCCPTDTTRSKVKFFGFSVRGENKSRYLHFSGKNGKKVLKI